MNWQVEQLENEVTSWPGGARVAVLLAPAGDPARAAVLKQVCGMSEADFGKFTLQQSFGGDAKGLPKILPSTTVVRQVVQLTPGALGIIGSSEPNDTVKLLVVE